MKYQEVDPSLNLPWLEGFSPCLYAFFFSQTLELNLFTLEMITWNDHLMIPVKTPFTDEAMYVDTEGQH